MLVCLSLFGWGDILRGSLRLRCGAGETACLGVGIAIACGGVLNLLHWVLPLTDAGFVALGAAAGLRRAAQFDFHPAAIPGSTATRILLLAVCLLAVCATTFYCYNFAFQIADDVPAYMVFPAKMLTGTLGFEPFSERRLLTSLGGLYFLQSLILTGAGPHWLHVIDPVFALIVTICLLDEAMRSHNVPSRQRLLLYLFLLLFLPETHNLTATLLPVPLFLLTGFTAADPLWREGRTTAQRTVCLAVTIAALIAMKALYLVPLAIVLAGLYLPGMAQAQRRIGCLVEGATTAGLTLLCLLPWMAASWWQTGTPLYPFLGTGFSTANFNADVLPLWRLTPLAERLTLFVMRGVLNAPMVLLLGLYVLLSLVTLCFGERPDRQRVKLPAVWIAATVTMILAICVGGAGEANLARYAYPGVAAAILLVLYAIVLVRGTDRSPLFHAGIFANIAVAACGVLLCFNRESIENYYDTGLFNLRMLYSGPDRTGETRHALVEAIQPGGGGIGAGIRRMQASVPPGETILERVDFPFLLDFRRNVIFVADWPGSAGPSPGWPARQGSKQLASYLAGQSVRYIAWSYANEALFPARLANDLPNDAWVRMDSARAFDFQDSLSEMMRICPLTFNDGARAIIHISDTCIEMLPSGRQNGEAQRTRRGTIETEAEDRVN
jgi:hypothetical protein